MFSARLFLFTKVFIILEINIDKIELIVYNINEAKTSVWRHIKLYCAWAGKITKAGDTLIKAQRIKFRPAKSRI